VQCADTIVVLGVQPGIVVNDLLTNIKEVLPRSNDQGSVAVSSLKIWVRIVEEQDRCDIVVALVGSDVKRSLASAILMVYVCTLVEQNLNNIVMVLVSSLV